MARHVTWISGAIAAMLLTACGGGAAPGASSAKPSANAANPAGSGSPGAASPSGASASTAAPSSAAAAPAAAGAAASGAAAGAGGAVKIGVILPLTGSVSEAGLNHRDGINLFLEQVHNTMAGRPVETVFADSQGRADLALPKAKELVENQKVQVLVGFTLTPECYAVSAYVKEAHVPMIVSDNCGAVHLTTDPKSSNPYVFRTSFDNQGQIGPLGDWAYEQGYRKAVLTASDYGGGYEIADAFAWSFVHRGGTIVQEQYPSLGATDFGPFLAQMTRDADCVFAFFPGGDGLRWAQQYPDYAGQHKLPVLAGAGSLARDGNLTALKDKAVGMVANDTWTEALDNPANKQLLRLYAEKYPDRRLSSDVANGYIVMEVLRSALEKINGRVEDQAGFLKALAGVNVQTAKGPVKFDDHRDVVENQYIYQIVKQGDRYEHKLLKTYPAVTQFFDQPAEAVEAFPFGKMKNRWVGMTKAQVDQLKS